MLNRQIHGVDESSKFQINKVSNFKKMRHLLNLAFIIFLVCFELASCYEIKGCHKMSNYEGTWRYSNFQAIFKCASDITKDMLSFGILEKETEDCLWLQNLDKCVKNFKLESVDCYTEIKDLIQSNVNVSTVEFRVEPTRNKVDLGSRLMRMKNRISIRQKS